MKIEEEEPERKMQRFEIKLTVEKEEDKSKSYFCITCQEAFPNSSSIFNHFQSHHQETQEQSANNHDYSQLVGQVDLI